MIHEFGSDNQTLIYVRDQNLWSPEKLAALEKLHLSFERLSLVSRVDSLYNLRSIKGVNGQIDSRIILSGALNDPALIPKAKASALDNPLIVGNFLSPGGNVTALLVSQNIRAGDKEFDQKANDAFNQIIASAQSDFDQIFQIGKPRISSELRSILVSDLLILGPLSALMLVFAILCFMRSWIAALLPLLTSGLSLIWTFGVMGWVGIPLNILSAMLPSLIIVIGSTEDIHMISAYFSRYSKTGSNHAENPMRFIMNHMAVPLILTVMTTALGFASNIFSNIALIQYFACASTIAVIANGVITIVLVPILLSVLQPPPKSGADANDKYGETGIAGCVVRTFQFTNRKFPVAILVGAALICLFFLYHASTLHVTNDPISYFQRDQPLVKDTWTIHRDLSGMKIFYISLESDRNKAFQDPKNIEKLIAVQTFLKKQAIFDRSISLADHLSLVNREFHGGDPDYYKPPVKRNLIAQYLLFFHRRDLEKYVSHDYQRANIIVRHNVSDSHQLNLHINELNDVVATIVGSDLKANIISENLMVNDAAETLMIAQIKSLTILICVIFLIMSAMFTSFKGGLISLIPNLIPIILMFGVMGYLEIPLNPGTAMVAVIAVGIAIDCTIHLLSRYNELCRKTSRYDDAVLATVKQEATPIVAACIPLALGFGVLLFSNFTVIAQFGALSAATMIFALFANLVITPIIMSRTRLVGLHQILALSNQLKTIEKSPLFYGMSNYQMRKAILIPELTQFTEGELLVKQHTVMRSMYLILSGKVEIVRQNENKSKKITELEAGQIFGEISYITAAERTADVKAITPVEALKFDYDKLNNDLKFFPYIIAKLNFNISAIIGKRLAGLLDDMELRENADAKQ